MEELEYLVPDLNICTTDTQILDSSFLYRCEEEIKKSHFIASLGRADTKEGARNFIAKIKEEFPDANHNCWAYAVGPPKDTANIGQSDDGEPHGTAGKPMLNILLHSDIGECVVVVTRYFGGIKLGPGGLVRAYQGLTASAMEQVQCSPKIAYQEIKLHCDYANINKVHHVMPQFEAKIIAENFDSQIEYTFLLPAKHVKLFIKTLQDLSHGNIKLIT